MVTHVIEGFKLSVDRGPNWLFVKLRPKRRFAEDVPQIADELWSIATRHFIYRVVLELEELGRMPAELTEQLVILQERLMQCGGSLRICGLPADCVEELCDSHLDVALPNFATRQDAVLGGDAAALHEKLKQSLCDSASDDDTQVATDFALHAPSLH
jgi:anti-sigma B factor antagonist